MSSAIGPDPESQGKGERLIDRLLVAYEERHTSLVNRLIQFVAVPVMMWSGYALLGTLPEPGFLAAVPLVDWAVVGAIVISLAYASLSPRLGAAIAVFSFLLILIAAFYNSNEAFPVWQPALVFLGLAVFLWLVGRRVEGRPRLLREMALDLLTGPAWLLARMLRVFDMRY